MSIIPSPANYHRCFQLLGSHLALARIGLGMLGFILSASIEIHGAENPYLHRLDTTGATEFILTEQTNHPHFWWPRTLLTYRVAYHPAREAPEFFTLTDDGTRQAVPFQLSAPDLDPHGGPDGNAQGTISVSFFADLPTGAQRHFTLRTATSATPPVIPSATIDITESDHEVVINSGIFRIKFPASSIIPVGAPVLGPIQGLDDGKGWMGRSYLRVAGTTVRQIDTTIIDRGPLFARVRVMYRFAESDATYAVTFRIAQGDDFAEMDEEIIGLPVAAKVQAVVEWPKIPFALRRGQEPIAGPHTISFRGEDPHFVGPARFEQVDQEMYVWLAPSAGDHTICTTVMDFTDPVASRSIGIAVHRGEGWDDHRYSLWASQDALAVKFRWADNQLSWLMPVMNGRRSLCVAAYDPDTVAARLGEAYQHWQRPGDADVEERAKANTGVGINKSRIAFINSRHGGMSLDVVKDWILNYDDLLPAPHDSDLFAEGTNLKNKDAYLNALFTSGEQLNVEGNWVSPVGLRVMSKWIVPGFARWRLDMTPEERRRAGALILMHAYIAAGDDISPMRHVLQGHPNFMADWKYPLIAAAYLFPHHPLAHEWADQFEKLLDIMGVAWVRPPVQAWEALGGRWTESIGVYNWAFIQPMIYGNRLGLRFDGRERWANSGLAMHARYLAGIVTAPVKLGKDINPLDVPAKTELTPANGFQRIHPPQGAHAGRRAIPSVAEDVALSLQRFDPLTAEHLLWAIRRPGGQTAGIEDGTIEGGADQKNQGTNPRLTSSKYTGYGFVLRSAVGTPHEISIFLQQIDKGPNYRWGFGNEGGCGDIYYYAGGRSYAGHFGEDAGDRRVTDTEVTCNSGVYRDHTFRSIGMNELTEPLYNLDAAQLAELLPRQGADAYSWPEYQSRSALLVGSDYVLTFDVVEGMSRMSWNTIKGQDQMPTIIPLRGETAFRVTQTCDGGKRSGIAESVRFEPYKGGGDRLALISHRTDLTATNRKIGNGTELVDVKGPDCQDIILLNRANSTVDDERVSFSGRAGVLRRHQDGTVDLILFHGQRLGTKQVELRIDGSDLGVSASYRTADRITGRCMSRLGGRVSIIRSGVKTAARIAIDGEDVPTVASDRSLTFAVPAGDHRWQLTTGAIEPTSPQIERTESQTDGARIYFGMVAFAKTYRIERSDDVGMTWKPIGETTVSPWTLGGISVPPNGEMKLHVRLVALGEGCESRPGHDYPIVITGRPLLPPTGCRARPDVDIVHVTWGQVLGASAYLVERRRLGTTTWQEVHRGAKTTYDDAAPGVVPAYDDPGLEAAAYRRTFTGPIYEYAIRAIDGVGVGPQSSLVTTDPASWLTWNPIPNLTFRRRSAYWLPPYVRPEQVPQEAYPR